MYSECGVQSSFMHPVSTAYLSNIGGKLGESYNFSMDDDLKYFNVLYTRKKPDTFANLDTQQWISYDLKVGGCFYPHFEQ